MKPSDACLYKAAVLIDSLDPPSADALLEQMGSELAARVRRAVMDLDAIDDAERERVIAEFLRIRVMAPADDPSGVELDGALALQLAAGDAPKRLVGPAEPQTRDRAPFRFLQEAASDTLTQVLEREHPQTIALVAAHLPPRQAADVLAGLPAALQTDVIRRVANLEATDPEILREVEQQMELILCGPLQNAGPPSPGLAAASAILSAVDTGDRQAILENLGRTDNRLASLLARPTGAQNETLAELDRPVDGGQPRAAGTGQASHGKSVPTRPGQTAMLERRQTVAAPSQPAPAAAREGPPPNTPTARPPEEAFSFGDFALLDDPSLTEVLRSADPQTVLLALTGAGRDLMGRIERRLPLREARRLRTRIEQLGPLRLSDVEDAQTRLAALVGRLAARGAIRLPTKRRLAFAA